MKIAYAGADEKEALSQASNFCILSVAGIASPVLQARKSPADDVVEVVVASPRRRGGMVETVLALGTSASALFSPARTLASMGVLAIGLSSLMRFDAVGDRFLLSDPSSDHVFVDVLSPTFSYFVMLYDLLFGKEEKGIVDQGLEVSKTPFLLDLLWEAARVGLMAEAEERNEVVDQALASAAVCTNTPPSSPRASASDPTARRRLLGPSDEVKIGGAGCGNECND